MILSYALPRTITRAQKAGLEGGVSIECERDMVNFLFYLVEYKDKSSV